MNTPTKLPQDKPFFRKETGHFVLYTPLREKMKTSTPEIIGKYKTWQEAQIESLNKFGRKAVQVT